MKVMHEKRWEKYLNCSACGSHLRLDSDDLRMAADETTHFVCEICDTKQTVDPPEYLVVKLKKLLAQKSV